MRVSGIQSSLVELVGLFRADRISAARLWDATEALNVDALSDAGEQVADVQLALMCYRDGYLDLFSLRGWLERIVRDGDTAAA